MVAPMDMDTGAEYMKLLQPPQPRMHDHFDPDVAELDTPGVLAAGLAGDLRGKGAGLGEGGI